jgi:hypothetical protein
MIFITFLEQFEDSKGVVRSRKSEDRQSCYLKKQESPPTHLKMKTLIYMESERGLPKCVGNNNPRHLSLLCIYLYHICLLCDIYFYSDTCCDTIYINAVNVKHTVHKYKYNPVYLSNMRKFCEI